MLLNDSTVSKFVEKTGSKQMIYHLNGLKLQC